MSPKPASSKRPRLSAERVLQGAVTLADEIGIADLTIRRLAEALDVKPMTIYHHVPNKEAIIDGMVDLVFSEIELPPADMDWRDAIRIRSRSMRDVLANHPWASPLMESRTNPGMATLVHHDAVLGCLRRGGLSLELTGHAYALIDAFLYGFAMQEATLPATGGEDMAELAESIADQMPADLLPHLAEFTIGHVLQPGYDFANEFEFSLNLILDGLATALATE
ncbi:MAG: TetR/AcrR family transcriptional regulator [Acidimicrobiales bacterium]|nr:MAG: TetR/AcrR family transcriptional regulator [Acidimicrobiales bacterium]